MPSGERYALQRADLLWYAGAADGAEAEWVPRLRHAVKMKDFDEAKRLQRALQEKGHRTYVMEV